MNRIKRLTAILLGVWLTVTLAACQKGGNTESEPTSSVDESALSARGDEMYDLYTAALEKADKQNGTNITLSGSYTVSASGRTSVTNVELTYQSIEKENKSTSAGSVIDTIYTDHLIADFSGSTESAYELYYKDGVAYRSENDTKGKQTVARSTALKDTALLQIIPLSRAAFDSPIIAEVEGDTIVSLPLNGDMLSDELLSETGAPHYILGQLDEVVTYTFHNVTVKLTFREDGYLVGYDLYYVMTADDAAQTSLSLSLATVFCDPDKAVSFKLPKLSEYTDTVGENTLSNKAYEAMPVIVDALFDADGKRVDDYDTLYQSLCKTYTEKVVDTVVNWFENQA